MRASILLVALTILLTLPMANAPLMTPAGQVQPSRLDNSHNLPTTTAAGGPLAAFTYNPCVMCAVVGDLVFFNGNWSISPSGSISSYIWDFGDGTPLYKTTSPSASHDYTLPGSGIWTVTLLVQDSLGQTDSVSQSVVFNIHPDFTYQPSKPAAGDLVSFDASSTQNFSTTSLSGFGWLFGDGTTGSGKLVTHSYTAAGLYRIILTVQTSQANAQVSETIIVGGSSTSGQNIILRSLFGIAYYNTTNGQITIQPATLFLNMTVIGTNSTGREFNINSGKITIGPSPTLAPVRNFTSTSGQAFQSNTGRLTVTAQMIEVISCQQYQPPCTVPNAIYKLFLTGPSRFVCLNFNCEFFTRLFGFLYNSQTKIGLFFIVGQAPGDVDEDGRVNISDLTVVGSNFGRNNLQTVMSQPCDSPNYPASYYVITDETGIVSIVTLTIVASNFGTAY